MPACKSDIDANDAARQLDGEWFARARPWHDTAAILRRGRPPLPEDRRKQRVNMYLDRDPAERLKQDGKGGQTRASALLRKAAGM